MTSPQAFNHSLLRPCVLHILRATGYHSTRPSVLDAFTDIAGRYIFLLATSAAQHSAINHVQVELTVEDVRMAMQECGALAPEKIMEEQIYDNEEDTRGVDAFLEWIMGPENKEIRRIALEGGEEGNEDYLTALKKKHSKTGEDARYQGTVLGKPTEPRAITVEGGEITTLRQWAEKLRETQISRNEATNMSRQQSSDLSSLEDQDVDGMDF